MISVPAKETPLPAVTALAIRSSPCLYFGVLHHDDCIRAARNHAAGGDQHCLSGMDGCGRDDAGVNLFLTQRYEPRHFFRGAERIFGHHRKAIDIGSIKRWHVDGRHDVSRQHPPQRRIQRNHFNARGRAVDGRPETPLRFIAVDDLEKLRPVQPYSQTVTSEPAAKPSLSSPTITNPSARVVDDRIDAPPTASGSTSPPVDLDARVIQAANRRTDLTIQCALHGAVRPLLIASSECAHRAAGRRNRRRTNSKPDCREAGNTSRCPIRPNPVGLLGRIAIPCTASSPCCATSIGARSSMPTLEPPDTMTTSASACRASQDGVGIVANQTWEIDYSTIPFHQRGEHRPVGIDNLKALRTRARGKQFIPSDHEPHARTSNHADASLADRTQDTQILRAQHTSLLQAKPRHRQYLRRACQRSFQVTRGLGR